MSTPTAQMAFEPAVLTAAMPEGGQAQDGRQWLPITATVRNISGPTYLLMLMDQPIFENEPVEISALGNDRYRALLPLRVSLPAGKYTGKITFKVCLDPACTTQHSASGAELPYEITVIPGIQLSVTVNGAAVTGNTITVTSGAVVSVTSTVPVDWRQGMGGAAAWDTVTTEKTWTGTLRYAQTPPGTARFDLYADSKTTPVAEVITHFLVNP